MYCENNPIMYADSNGHAPKWLKNVLDIGLYVASAVVSIVVGIAVSSVINPVAGITAGIATFSALNNATNAIYYNCISDGVNDAGVTSSSYTENGYINRWDRLDYTKDQTKEDNYNINAWRYFSEYNFHMYAWLVTKSKYTGKKGDGFLSDIAYSASSANVDPKNFEDGPNRWRNIFYIGIGLLGF